jgi:hypothetical protein
MANGHGGKRAGAGMPPGTITHRTADKALAREEARKLIAQHINRMMLAQVEAACGLNHFMLRDPETGQFERITDPDQIAAALNAAGASEGSTYHIWAKDPNVGAFNTLAAYYLDKPKEQVQEIEITGEAELIDALMGGRQRAAKAKGKE